MIVIYSLFFYFFSKRKQHGNGRFPNENASKMLNSPHFLVTKMPYSIPSNATLYHRKCHTLCLLKCGVLLKETKYFKQMRKDNVTLLKIKWL